MGYVVGIRDIKEVLIQEDNKVIIVCANYKIAPADIPLIEKLK